MQYFFTTLFCAFNYYYLKFSSLHLLLLYSVFKVLFSGILLPFYGSSFLFADFLFIGLVGTNGLEPSTSRLSGVRSNHLSYAPFLFCGWLSVFFSCFTFGGDEEDRTPDPLLAGQVLSQLSYTPSGLAFSVFFAFSRIPFSRFLFRISAFTETFKIEQCFL